MSLTSTTTTATTSKVIKELKQSKLVVQFFFYEIFLINNKALNNMKPLAAAVMKDLKQKMTFHHHKGLITQMKLPVNIEITWTNLQ